MTTTYGTKLFKSVIDCGCNLSLGEFSTEARFEDVEEWIKERGYILTKPPQVKPEGDVVRPPASDL